MTPEELALQQAQSETANQISQEGARRAQEQSYAVMSEHAQQIQADIQKRDDELKRIGFPTQPYQPGYSSPGMTLGERVGAIGEYAGEAGRTAVQSVQTVGAGVVGGLGNMMSDIGAAVRPIFKTQPMPVAIGYGGYHIQRQGLFEGITTVLGGGHSSQSTMTMENRSVIASDVGERLSMGGMAAAATLGGIGASFLAAKIPGAAAAGGAIGGAAGRMIGLRGAGAAIGRFAMPWLALPLAGYEAGEAAVDAVRSRRETENFLEASAFRFAGSGSDMLDTRMGRGIGRESRQEISEFIRRADISDPMMSGADLATILQEGTRFGMFEGAGSDIEQFKRRFSEIKDNVREVAKTLNVSIEEGLATMKELYGAGVDLSKTREISQLAAATGRVAGRTGTEMITLGLQGAEQFRGTGVDMDIGMRGAMMNLTAIRAARDAGTISKAAIEQAGGEEALAMRRTQRQVQFAQSEEGRGFMASFFNPSTGGLDLRAFERVAGGQDVDIADLAKQAAQNLSDPAKLIQFESQQEQMASEMGKAFGGRGLQFGQWNLAMAEANMMSQMTGASREDSFRAIMLRKGVSPQELEAMQGEISASAEVFGASQRGAQTERDRLAMEEAERNKILTRIEEKMGDVAKSLVDLVAGPMNTLVNKTTEVVEGISDTLSGVERADVSKVATGDMGGISAGTMVSGTAEAQERKRQLYGKDAEVRSKEAKAVQEAISGPLDLSGGGGWFRSGSGENLSDLLTSGALGEGMKDAIITTKNKGDLAVMTGQVRKKVTGGMVPRIRDASYSGLTEAGAARLESLGRVLGMTDDDVKTLEEQDRLVDEIGGASIKVAIGELDFRGLLDPSKGLDVATNQILQNMGVKGPDGKPATIETLTLEQSASIVQKLREQPAFAEAFEKSRKAWTQYQKGMEVGRAKGMQVISESYEGIREKISDRYRGLELSDEGLASIGRAQALMVDASQAKSPEEAAVIRNQADKIIFETYANEMKREDLDPTQKKGMREFFGVIRDYDPATAKEMVAKERRLSDLNSRRGDLSREEEKERLILSSQQRGFAGAELLTELGSISRGLVRYQADEAKDLFGDMLYAEMITNKDLTSEDVRGAEKLISRVIDDPLALAKLTKEERETLSKTKAGAVFAERGGDIVKLQNAITAARGDKDKEQAAFIQAFGETQGTKYFDQYQDDKNLQGIIASSFENTVAQTVGLQKAATGGYTDNTAMKNSTELFRVMTAENWVVLGALQSLHNKMKE